MVKSSHKYQRPRVEVGYFDIFTDHRGALDVSMFTAISVRQPTSSLNITLVYECSGRDIPVHRTWLGSVASVASVR
jgi:uncharacterized protein (UPF0248 family)